MKDIKKFMAALDSNIGYKTIILPLLPKGDVNILDFGGGTGVLSHAIRLSNPQSHITLLDSNPQMIEVAKENNTADLYVHSMSELPNNSYDAIVLCSVLHEVPDWKKLIKDLSNKLKFGGSLIIRDGCKSFYKNKRRTPYSLILKDPIEAQMFFDVCEPNSIIGRLDINFVSNLIQGNREDVHAFLQTYTWGIESLAREQHENHLFASVLELKRFFSSGFQVFDMNTFKGTEICQQDYFKHLEKLVDIKTMWNTHMVVKINRY